MCRRSATFRALIGHPTRQAPAPPLRRSWSPRRNIAPTLPAGHRARPGVFQSGCQKDIGNVVRNISEARLAVMRDQPLGPIDPGIVGGGIADEKKEGHVGDGALAQEVDSGVGDNLRVVTAPLLPLCPDRCTCSSSCHILASCARRCTSNRSRASGLLRRRSATCRRARSRSRQASGNRQAWECPSSHVGALHGLIVLCQVIVDAVLRGIETGPEGGARR